VRSFGFLVPTEPAKTTTIRMRIGLIRPQSGVVLGPGKGRHGGTGAVIPLWAQWWRRPPFRLHVRRTTARLRLVAMGGRSRAAAWTRSGDVGMANRQKIR